MPGPERTINPHISVDCVIFGFSRNRLKVLLVKRDYRDKHGQQAEDFKLPGDLISPSEDLDSAAARTLRELTGLHDIFLRQFSVFGHPDRISKRDDIEWLKDTTGMEIHRVVTTAYYSLINISETNKGGTTGHQAHWADIHSIPPLAFDHEKIIHEGLIHLQHALRYEPVGFNLLPPRFTIRELQSVYEAILGCELDNRNFRKKILKSSYLVQMNEKQTGVAHKPARYYRFDHMKYEKQKKDYVGFIF